MENTYFQEIVLIRNMKYIGMSYYRGMSNQQKEKL